MARGDEAAAYPSPLPPAAFLAAYEQIIVGSADRILTVFEQQAQHRMSMERARQQSDARRADLGLVAGFLVALAVLAASAYCATISQPWVAGILGGLDIVALAGIFIYGTERRRSERLQALRIIRESEQPANPAE